MSDKAVAASGVIFEYDLTPEVQDELLTEYYAHQEAHTLCLCTTCHMARAILIGRLVKVVTR